MPPSLLQVSTNASYPIEAIVAAAPHHPFFFQLYVNKNRAASEALLQQVYSLGIRTVFLTVDAAVAGKREADERVRADETLRTPMGGTAAVNDRAGGGLARIMGTFIDDRLNWDDLVWLRRHWKGKVVLKGIMGAEDAKRAAQEGVDGIVLRYDIVSFIVPRKILPLSTCIWVSSPLKTNFGLCWVVFSNHGGRNLDTSPPSILILLELQKHCPEIFDQLEVYVDGGIRRGTDILKALCLGATAVLMGRTFLYALNYGEEGVEHLIDRMWPSISFFVSPLIYYITHPSKYSPICPHYIIFTSPTSHLPFLPLLPLLSSSSSSSSSSSN